MNDSNKIMQIALSMKYKELLRSGGPFPEFGEVEFRAFSQNGEDGILLYLFSMIGTTNKKAVEICAGNGIECNTANLIINHGWDALLVDGNAEHTAEAESFYSSHPDTWLYPPTIRNEWITAENVNSIVASSGFSGAIDLLCIDLDGNDYWIWNALDCVEPRVVVAEYNNLWGHDDAVTIPYRPDFTPEYNDFGADYFGASLAALVKLARSKGYRLVGCQKWNFNAFFIKNGIMDDVFPEVPAEQCLRHPFCTFSREQRLPLVAGREWTVV